MFEFVPIANGLFSAEPVASYETTNTIIELAICDVDDPEYCLIATAIGDTCDIYRVRYIAEGTEVNDPSQKHNLAEENEGESLPGS